MACAYSLDIKVPFLNYMSIIAEKAGAVHVRVGGNTQETAFVVDSLPDGGIIEKNKEDASNPVRTKSYSRDLEKTSSTRTDLLPDVHAHSCAHSRPAIHASKHLLAR